MSNDLKKATLSGGNSNSVKISDNLSSEAEPPKAKQCEVCRAADSVYCCPRCNLRSCSLACCTTHKMDTHCDGVRDVAKFVPRTEYSHFDLLSDYRFLENIDRSVETYAKDNLKMRAGVFRRNRRLGHIASQRGLELTVLPAAMHRHKMNSTYFDPRSKSLYWTVEFRVPRQPGGSFENCFILFLHGCQESETMSALLNRVLSPSKQPADVWFDLKSVASQVRREGQLFLRYEPSLRAGVVGASAPSATPLNKPHYREVAMDTPLGHALGGVRIVEYPTFFLDKKSNCDQYKG